MGIEETQPSGALDQFGCGLAGTRYMENVRLIVAAKLEFQSFKVAAECTAKFWIL